MAFYRVPRDGSNQGCWKVLPIDAFGFAGLDSVQNVSCYRILELFPGGKCKAKQK